MPKTTTISVFGAGSLGQAIIYLAASNKNKVNVYDANPQQLKKAASHPKLKALKNITFFSKIDHELYTAEFIIPAIPSQPINQFYQQLQKHYSDNIIISVTKGFYPKTNQTISQTVKDFIPTSNFIVLSGPNFANEIFNHAPTITTLAGTSPIKTTKAQKIFQTAFFHISRSKKVLPTEICGIYKNCYAITLGIIDQVSHAMNSKALAITRILEEITPLFSRLKTPALTTSPTFLGDLIATGLNPNSRNYRYGYLLKKDAKATTEGVDNIKPAINFAKQHKINLPLLVQTEKILKHRYQPEKILKLL